MCKDNAVSCTSMCSVADPSESEMKLCNESYYTCPASSAYRVIRVSHIYVVCICVVVFNDRFEP